MVFREEIRHIYDLSKDSLVFDLGGFKGDWTNEIFTRYSCNIHIFEPVKSFSKNISKRFLKNNKIILHNFGLSDKPRSCMICVDGDGSSIFKKGRRLERILLVKASDFFENYNINKIDLMKINIEGGEYDLLDHLIDTGFIKHIRDVQIQFHRIEEIPDAEERRDSIRRQLEKTHCLTYDYPFVWENWRLKI